ncbi:GDSL-type esterase/lipase family protein [Fictibacillus terranigra]|uniref:GDSL-type esterase/lipase family protein n=1 Tax=Fictibacillus terranigra TaxID=3058424 RepID=A0ABT8E759_9BACL|nr:GDSL-type esterase/lipase family protein [Fictibacillus sp. CENA-BCM004]MDN4073730.1 GDSL-type esterase/lipase family protein [Fictibacillus sp. CENA-BCM004]
MKTLVCFGDSITSKEKSDDGSLRLTSRVRLSLQKWNVINAGVPAETTRVALTRFQEDVLRHNPDLVTILFGANDASSHRLIEVEEYKNNLEYMIEKLGPSKVILVSPSPVNERFQHARSNEGLKHYAKAVRELAKKYNTHFVDLWAEMIGKDYCQMLNEDGLHFNKKGYKLLADLVIQKMEKLTKACSTKPILQQ